MSESRRGCAAPQIDPRAVVEEGAVLGQGVVIEPYAVVKRHVVLEEDVVIKSHAYIDGHTTIGQGTCVYPCASIGTKTQARQYQGEKTCVKIGKRCEIREFATINSSFGQDSEVVIGDDCLIMAYCHIAHHCTLGQGVTMSNNSTLAGHVEVEKYAVIGGFSPIHQFVRIGAYAMVGGMSRIGQDVPPYMIGGDIPFRLAGINRVGLKRHGFCLQKRQKLVKAYRLLFRSDLPFDHALDTLSQMYPSSNEIAHLVSFCRQSKRGVIGLCKQPENPEESMELDEEDADTVLSLKS